MLKREEIRIRDPYIVTDKEAGCYYMFGTLDAKEGSYRTYRRFSVCKTYDLENFEEPKVVFDGEKQGFWATDNYWAPEVHKFNGKYYIFGSVKSENRRRGTCIFSCDTLDGQYVPVSEDPITPPDWECLDGTFLEENGVPYMVFCHEWVQVKDGEIWAVELKKDLSAPAGEPFLLFKASEAKDLTAHRPGCYVTDGPFFYKEDGKLKMIWSSLNNGRYVVLGAESDNGSVHGKWIHTGSKFDFDGGHAMIFETLEGKRMISLHSPNKTDFERAAFFEF